MWDDAIEWPGVERSRHTPNVIGAHRNGLAAQPPRRSPCSGMPSPAAECMAIPSPATVVPSPPAPVAPDSHARSQAGRRPSRRRPPPARCGAAPPGQGSGWGSAAAAPKAGTGDAPQARPSPLQQSPARLGGKSAGGGAGVTAARDGVRECSARRRRVGSGRQRRQPNQHRPERCRACMVATASGNGCVGGWAARLKAPPPSPPQWPRVVRRAARTRGRRRP